MTKMMKVKKMLAGKDPKDIAHWFLEKSLILMKEAGVPKKVVIKYIEDNYDRPIKNVKA